MAGPTVKERENQLDIILNELETNSEKSWRMENILYPQIVAQYKKCRSEIDVDKKYELLGRLKTQVSYFLYTLFDDEVVQRSSSDDRLFAGLEALLDYANFTQLQVISSDGFDIVDKDEIQNEMNPQPEEIIDPNEEILDPNEAVKQPEQVTVEQKKAEDQPQPTYIKDHAKFDGAKRFFSDNLKNQIAMDKAFYTPGHNVSYSASTINLLYPGDAMLIYKFDEASGKLIRPFYNEEIFAKLNDNPEAYYRFIDQFDLSELWNGDYFYFAPGETEAKIYDKAHLANQKNFERLHLEKPLTQEKIDALNAVSDQRKQLSPKTLNAEVLRHNSEVIIDNFSRVNYHFQNILGSKLNPGNESHKNYSHYIADSTKKNFEKINPEGSLDYDDPSHSLSEENMIALSLLSLADPETLFGEPLDEKLETDFKTLGDMKPDKATITVDIYNFPVGDVFAERMNALDNWRMRARQKTSNAIAEYNKTQDINVLAELALDGIVQFSKYANHCGGMNSNAAQPLYSAYFVNNLLANPLMLEACKSLAVKRNMQQDFDKAVREINSQTRILKIIKDCAESDLDCLNKNKITAQNKALNSLYVLLDYEMHVDSEIRDAIDVTKDIPEELAYAKQMTTAKRDINIPVTGLRLLLQDPEREAALKTFIIKNNINLDKNSTKVELYNAYQQLALAGFVASMETIINKENGELITKHDFITDPEEKARVEAHEKNQIDMYFDNAGENFFKRNNLNRMIFLSLDSDVPMQPNANENPLPPGFNADTAAMHQNNLQNRETEIKAFKDAIEDGSPYAALKEQYMSLAEKLIRNSKVIGTEGDQHINFRNDAALLMYCDKLLRDNYISLDMLGVSRECQNQLEGIKSVYGLVLKYQTLDAQLKAYSNVLTETGLLDDSLDAHREPKVHDMLIEKCAIDVVLHQIREEREKISDNPESKLDELISESYSDMVDKYLKNPKSVMDTFKHYAENNLNINKYADSGVYYNIIHPLESDVYFQKMQVNPDVIAKASERKITVFEECFAENFKLIQDNVDGATQNTDVYRELEENCFRLSTELSTLTKRDKLETKDILRMISGVKDAQKALENFVSYADFNEVGNKMVELAQPIKDALDKDAQVLMQISDKDVGKNLAEIYDDAKLNAAGGSDKYIEKQHTELRNLASKLQNMAKGHINTNEFKELCTAAENLNKEKISPEDLKSLSEALYKKCEVYINKKKIVPSTKVGKERLETAKEIKDTIRRLRGPVEQKVDQIEKTKSLDVKRTVKDRIEFVKQAAWNKLKQSRKSDENSLYVISDKPGAEKAMARLLYADHVAGQLNVKGEQAALVLLDEKNFVAGVQKLQPVAEKLLSSLNAKELDSVLDPRNNSDDILKICRNHVSKSNAPQRDVAPIK